MREIRTEIVADATPESVWDVLTDLPTYAEWNPQTTSASGEVRTGESVRIRVEPTGRRAVSLSPTVTIADRPNRLRWVGRVGPSWLFRAEHTFDLEPLERGRTRVVNRERLSGILVPFVTGRDTYRDYDAMNRALADRAAHVEQLGQRV